jgi:two-component system, OmpR family, response regulator CpxR
MSIITAFTGTYCIEETEIRDIARKTGFKYLTDDDIVTKASSLSGLDEDRIRKAFRSGKPFLNQFTHEKELSVAYLKLALANTLAEDNIFINGFTSFLIPSSIGDVLRICIISDMKSRVSAAGNRGISERDALKTLHRDDANGGAWVKEIMGKDDPWDSSLYDMVLPTDQISPDDIGDTVAESIGRAVVDRTASAKKSIEDFALASRIESALINKGYPYVAAKADSGAVTLTIKKNVLMLKKLERILQSVAQKASGVTRVTIKVGKEFYQSDIVRQFNLEMPSKPFFEDDKRLFMPVLSKKVVFDRSRYYNRI